ncbi:hypothetical protein OU995_18455 [Roseateles sp. SL47]|uniref:hypothetical protein n=1 Tax=Roseateles sp. SL47 TaxID=2995138 RepID=UPI002270178B|nr:hypothetical protein [Roseateles sp. SL47]WAC71554.1 hypothetical protein OU995_18455 [Roseateles sp. SL47]
MSEVIKRRPRIGLKADHLQAVREVLAAHPGLALRKLAPLVAQRLELPHVSDHALHNFLALHAIPRQVPQHVIDRSARLKAKGPLLLSAPLVAVDSSPVTNVGPELQGGCNAI